MAASEPLGAEPPGTSDPSAEDPVEVEAVLAWLQEMLAGTETGCIYEAWERVERASVGRLEREERSIMARLLEAHPRQARALLHEHAYLRLRLVQLRATLPRLSRAAVGAFADEVRAHARHRDMVFHGAPEAP